jgi:hypothetical protein
VGSAAAPKAGVELIGESGEKALVEAKKEGDEKGLAAYFAKDQGSLNTILGADGLPPSAPGLFVDIKGKESGEKTYELLDDQTYEGA